MRLITVLLLCLVCILSGPALAERRGTDKNFIIPLPININTASEETLIRALEGIGEKKAQAIIAYRNEHGPFATVEDLGNVKGIGPGTLRRNEGRMTVE